MNRGKPSRASRTAGRRHSAIVTAGVLAVVVAGASLGAFYVAGVWAPESRGFGPQSGEVLEYQRTRPTRGGPFSLVDCQGDTVTDADFRGRMMLVFFGYTYCPDVCPTELSTMAGALDILGAAGEAVQPILISVDPERDTVEAMADYVAAFHPRLIGLTGTPEQVAAAAQVYRVVYVKVPLGPDEGGDGDDYGVAHSASIYLVGPDGGILAVFPRGLKPEDMAAGISRFLAGGA